MLLSLVGWQITLVYVMAGMAIWIAGGVLLDLIRAEKLLQSFALKAYESATVSDASEDAPPRWSFKERHEFAKNELSDIVSRVWKWVFIGVGLGTALHGFIPENWFEQNLGSGQWWSVPMAVLAGIPLYSNATGVIPVMESLIVKGLPPGMTLAFCMSKVAASFPEFILLKQVMTWRLLVIVLAILLTSFIQLWWIINLFYIA
jgi:uncharacterized membrane protein YraQ (UPF0718 family)